MNIKFKTLVFVSLSLFLSLFLSLANNLDISAREVFRYDLEDRGLILRRCGIFLSSIMPR
jgi:hypothetical protein